MADRDFREIERDRDDRLADEAGEASGRWVDEWRCDDCGEAGTSSGVPETCPGCGGPNTRPAERLTFDTPDVDAVVLTESGEAKRFGDWTAADLEAALARLRREVEERG